MVHAAVRRAIRLSSLVARLRRAHPMQRAAPGSRGPSVITHCRRADASPGWRLGLGCLSLCWLCAVGGRVHFRTLASTGIPRRLDGTEALVR